MNPLDHFIKKFFTPNIDKFSRNEEYHEVCPYCGQPAAYPIGKLGKRLQFRCTHCGGQFSYGGK